MSYESAGAEALDYHLCHYGRSRLVFRGPARDVTGDFVAVIGGGETFGRFVARPYPELLEQALGLPVANLGVANAGPEVFLGDAGVAELCRAARVTAVQIIGAQNLTNRFYAVHPRRNDRFLRASGILKALYPEVDFSEFHFTGHMLRALSERSAERFAPVAAEMRRVWVQRMTALLRRIGGQVLLLHLHEGSDGAAEHDLSLAPPFVDLAMVTALRPLAAKVVRVTVSAAARHEGVAGMHFAPQELPQAERMPGPLMHVEIADALLPAIRRLIGR